MSDLKFTSAHDYMQSDYSAVTRVEVINNQGRVCTELGVVDMKFDLQDDGQTLKIFVTTDLAKEQEVRGMMANKMSAMSRLAGKW